MEEKSKWHIAAFACGLIFASVFGWAYGSLSPHASTLDYARVMGLTFLAAFGAGALVYVAPGWWLAFWYQNREAERLRLEAATFQRQRRNLAFDYTPPAAEIKTVDNDREAARATHLRIAQYVIDSNRGQPHYKDGLDKVMNYAAWRWWADALVRDGILSPIAGGVRTQWAEGWSAARLLGRLEGGYQHPAPPGAPPTVQLDNR